MNTFRAGLMAGMLASAAIVAIPAQAQDDGYGLHAGALEVAVNKSQVVTSDRAIDRALIGNDAIADIVPISERSVYVLGKGVGTTSLTLYDRLNRVIAVMDIQVGPDVESLRTQIGDLLPGSDIQASLSNGSVVLSGMVADAGAADRAMRIASAYAGENVVNLMTVGGSQQVMLEVRFAEVSRNLGERLGSRAFLNDLGGDFNIALGPNATATGTSPFPELSVGTVSDAFGILSSAFTLGGIRIDSLLDALERRGLSKTLAEPTLVALSGETASFLAGGEFPIPVAQSSGSGGGDGGGQAITVEFKPFGVSLAFTPTVLGGDVISLVVEPEVSSLDPAAAVTVNGITVPGLQTRRASTTLEMRDGESFAIAGLLREDHTTSTSSLPLLGSLPIIGSLFRSSQYQKGETELLIVVTPRLVQPIRPGQVRLPTDRVDDPEPYDVLTDGIGYRPVRLPPPEAAPVPPAGVNEVTEGESGYEF